MLRRALCLLLVFFLALPAAAAEAPLFTGDVWDAAGVLSDAAADDLAALNGRMGDGRLMVATRHFLGGADAGAYAQELLDGLPAPDNAAVLLLVIGEEDYALALGSQLEKLLPAETRQSLLAQHFRTPYLNRAYDQAVADFALAYAGQVSRARGEKIDLSGLFGRASAATPAPSAWGGRQSDLNTLWQDFFGADFPDLEELEGRAPSEDNLGEGISIPTIVFWCALIYFLFLRKRRRRRYDFGHGPRRRW